MKYAIRYEEILADTYFVEADSFSEAKEKLDKALRNGEISSPDSFQECNFSDLEWDQDDIQDLDVE